MNRRMITEPPAPAACPTHESERAVTIQEIYEQSIKPLPAPQRFQLAVLILNDIPPHALVDYSEEWSEEDLRDLMRANQEHIERTLGSEEE